MGGCTIRCDDETLDPDRKEKRKRKNSWNPPKEWNDDRETERTRAVYVSTKVDGGNPHYYRQMENCISSKTPCPTTPSLALQQPDLIVGRTKEYMQSSSLHSTTTTISFFHHHHHHSTPLHSTPLPPLHQQEVQPSIPQHQKHTTNNPQPSHIMPQRQDIKPETAQDSTAGHFDVEAVLLVDERQVAHLVDDQAFEAEVEDR
jgi:hypothetical protein